MSEEKRVEELQGTVTYLEREVKELQNAIANLANQQNQMLKLLGELNQSMSEVKFTSKRLVEEQEAMKQKLY